MRPDPASPSPRSYGSGSRPSHIWVSQVKPTDPLGKGAHLIGPCGEPMISRPSTFSGIPTRQGTLPDARRTPLRNDNTPLAGADLQLPPSSQTIAGERGGFFFSCFSLSGGHLTVAWSTIRRGPINPQRSRHRPFLSQPSQSTICPQ